MLSGRQRRFVEEYLLDLNGKAAAVRAGYAPPSAAKSAWNNLAHPAIAAAIAAAEAQRVAAAEMRAEEVLRELAAIAYGNILDHMRDGLPVFDPAARDAALAAFTVETFTTGRGAKKRAGRRRRITMHGKVAALDRLARHCGVYQRRARHPVPEASVAPPQDKRQALAAVLALLREGQPNAVSSPRGRGADAPSPTLRFIIDRQDTAEGWQLAQNPVAAPSTTLRAVPLPRFAGEDPTAGALTRRQKLFVAEYVVDRNGKAAAMRAGYSPRWAKEIAYQTLARPAVAAAIAEAQTKRLAAAEIDAAHVLSELSAVGRANLADYLRHDRDGASVFDLSRLDRLSGPDRARAAALSELLVEELDGEAGSEIRCVRIKTHDKLAALDRLGRHYGLFRGQRGESEERPAEGPQHSARQLARAVLAMMREAQMEDGERNSEACSDG